MFSGLFYISSQYNGLVVMKPLPPSLREKNRYIVYEVCSESGLHPREVGRAVQDAGVRVMGEFGMAAAGMVMLPDWKHARGMLKVRHYYVDAVKASFLTIQEIQGKKAEVRSVGVSGMLGKARLKFMNQKGGH